MRHLNKKRKLGMETSRRKAFLKNVFTSLLAHGKIKTTEIRGKELVRIGNSLIEKAKKGDLSSRRKVSSHITNDKVSINFFQETLPKLANRKGGHLRLIRVGTRKGDGAKVVIVELITTEDGMQKTDDRKQKTDDKKSL
jgi:large subunit ribosomal protein L17